MNTRPRRPSATVYTIDLDQATIDALVRGICPESLSRRAHELMGWQREAIRATTPEKKYTHAKNRTTKKRHTRGHRHAAAGTAARAREK